MMGLPIGCLNCCLSARKVACFLCAESQKVFRQLFEKPPVAIEDSGLPTVAMFPRQTTLSCLIGCLLRESER